MSLFDDTDDNQEVLDVKPEDLVGEGKRFANLEALAKSKLEADRFIAQLQKENSEAREKLQSAATMEAIMTKIAEMQTVSPQGTQEQQPPASTANDSDVNEKLKSLVASMLAEKDQESRKASNLDTAIKRVTDKFGADAQGIIRRKAAQLNLSMAEMQKMAAERPQVFLDLVGVAEDRPSVMAAPVARNGGVVQEPQGGEVRNSKFYDKLKAQNFLEYISPKTQNQMMKDAIKLGDAFYS